MQPLAWVGFLLLIAFFLSLDLGVFHKKDEVVTTKSALRWTLLWFVVAMAFNVLLYFSYERHWLGMGVGDSSAHNGKEAALQFFTGYLVEQSLSVDNIFVIALVFRFFKVPGEYQHRVLFWGILGAIVLRIIMILLGAVLIKNFAFMTYIFGGILVFTAIKMALSKGDEQFDPEDSRIVKVARKLFDISPNLDGHNFFTRINGKRIATPLFLVLIVVEGTDVVFAVDSIPAVFGVTSDPFIVFTSNIFAIMGLRSLYFALAGMLREFAYLKHSLVVVLGFVGVKMLIAKWVHLSAPVSLGVIIVSLAVGIVASLLKKEEGIPEDELKSIRPPGTPSADDTGEGSPKRADATGPDGSTAT